MIIDHIAIYTNKLEELKEFYIKYFDGVSNSLYFNEKKQFRSYFITFKNGTRIELMSMPGIPANANDTIHTQHTGLIHLAFGVDKKEDVDAKAFQLANDGFMILDGPRKTGDGYYEFVTLDPDGNRIEVTTVNNA
jgi:lactoylglutathione lyase